MNNDKSLRWSRRLGIVPRWVVIPTIQNQTVAAHVFNVTRTALWLVRTLPHVGGKGMSREYVEHQVLIMALEHDDDEAATGDSPSPTKAPKDFSAYSTTKLIVKIADMLESLAFLQEEEAMGNRRVKEAQDYTYSIYVRAWAALRTQYGKIGLPLPTADQVLADYLTVLNCKHPGLEAHNETS